MLGDFFESFGKKEDEHRELPREIIELLNKSLPDSFEYVIDNKGNYKAIPKAENLSRGINITTLIDFEKSPELYDKLQHIPREKWGDYIFRTQTALPIKSAKVGDEKKLVPIEILSSDPLHSDGAVFVEGIIKPYPFQETKRISFESPEGDVVQISFRQQAYDSVTEIKFVNIDFPALRIELYLYNPLVDEIEEKAHTNKNKQIMATYSVLPSKALTVKEAVKALHIFQGLYNGMTKVDGKPVLPEEKNGTYNPIKVLDALNFWENALKIEEKLEVSFNPGAELPHDDVRLFTELQTCFVEGKAIVWRHPFDHFHAEGLYSIKEGAPIENNIGNDSIKYVFLEGPIPATLLGARFFLYSHTEMKDFVITHIKWDDDNHENAEVYISDMPDKQWCLKRLYITKKEAEKLKDQQDKS